MTHVSDDANTIYVGWLPDWQLLVGIEPIHEEGRAIYMDEQQADELALALFKRRNIQFKDLQLSVARREFSDPNLNGMELQIGIPGGELASVLVLDQHLNRICGAIDTRLLTEEVEIDHDPQM